MDRRLKLHFYDYALLTGALFSLVVGLCVRAQTPAPPGGVAAQTQLVNQLSATWDDGTAVSAVAALTPSVAPGAPPAAAIFSAALDSTGSASYTMLPTFAQGSYTVSLTCQGDPACPNGTVLFSQTLQAGGTNACTVAYFSLVAGIAAVHVEFVFRKKDFSIARISEGATLAF